MPLKCIYRRLGPLYDDFMGFDMGFLLLFSFFVTPPQPKQMKDTVLPNSVVSVQRISSTPAHVVTAITFCAFFCTSVCIQYMVRVHIYPHASVSAASATAYKSEHRTDGWHSRGPFRCPPTLDSDTGICLSLVHL